MRRLFLLAIRGYQVVLSPLLPPSCRFVPSCSQYAHEAVQVHGPLAGTWLAVRRVMRCGPWHVGGVDLVPPRVTAAPSRVIATPQPK